MFKKTLIIVTLLATQTLFAAQDHNSSRSNKTASIAADTSDLLNEASKHVQVIGDDVDQSLLKQFKQIENQAACLKDRMLVDTFVKLMLKNVKRNGCKSFEDEDCVSKSIEAAEEAAYRKNKDGQVCGSTNHF